ncbi:MAG: hypothetical protein M1812_003353 [Candelaria pacifica]|nr:MAG: hypothetical protein M1812_003353 [Candelaria pacifica]
MNPQRRPQLRSRISDSGSISSTQPTIHRTRADSTATDNNLPATIFAGSMDYKDSLPTYSTPPRPPPSPRRPLIDFVKNEWRTDPKYAYSSTSNHEPDWLSMMKAPRFRRYAIVYLMILSTCWMTYKWWLRPMWTENVALTKSLDDKERMKKGWFGVNMRPAFTDMIHLKTLDEGLLPKSGKHDAGQRLIIVGDVHGCKDELIALLDEVSFNPLSDHLILAGDIIAKGPDSGGVIDLAQQMGASCVRGNHEDRILLAHRSLHSASVPLQGPTEDPHNTDDDMSEESFSHGDYKDRALAKELNDKQIKWLKTCPVILRVGNVDGMGEVVVVHAGLVPGVDLERQDPFNVMNMRTIDLDTHVPSEGRDGGVAWTKVWNKFQKRLDKEERSTVVYGHDSRVGLHIKKFSKGLDSGCVRGGRLTALVVEGGKYEAKQSLVGVDCKDQRRRHKVEGS